MTERQIAAKVRKHFPKDEVLQRIEGLQEKLAGLYSRR
jgi:hypothetical protein